MTRNLRIVGGTDWVEQIKREKAIYNLRDRLNAEAGSDYASGYRLGLFTGGVGMAVLIVAVCAFWTFVGAGL
jgi:hypothetical protein